MYETIVPLVCAVLTTINVGITIVNFRILRAWKKTATKKKHSLFN